MAPNSPKHKNKPRVQITATANVADFSFGSPESRAMARSILKKADGQPKLSQDEWDCLRLYDGEVYLNATMTPDYQDLERTAAYARGAEISERLWGPVVPAHLDPVLKRCSSASINFEMAFDREPRAGDILRVEDMQRIAISKRLDVEEFIQAWERQLPEMPCPLRVDGERILHRVNDKIFPPSHRAAAGEGFLWIEATEFRVEQQWRSVEREAFEGWAKDHNINDLARSAHCSAVAFLGVVDGKHQCRPADES